MLEDAVGEAEAGPEAEIAPMRPDTEARFNGFSAEGDTICASNK